MEGVLAWSASVLLFKQAICHLACARESETRHCCLPKEDNLIAVIGKPILSLGPSFGAGNLSLDVRG